MSSISTEMIVESIPALTPEEAFEVCGALTLKIADFITDREIDNYEVAELLRRSAAAMDYLYFSRL
jgi:hypothetical protein